MVEVTIGVTEDDIYEPFIVRVEENMANIIFEYLSQVKKENADLVYGDEIKNTLDDSDCFYTIEINNYFYQYLKT